MGRREESRKIREDAAKIAFERKHATKHEDNGEEDKYKDADGNRNFIANYSKGFNHHPPDNRDAGEVINQDYRKLVDAVKSGRPSDFENLTLGPGGRLLTNPQAGLAFDLEGPDSHDLAIRPAPTIGSQEAAGEMAELYWMALCRDIPFNKFEVPDPLIGEAVADLSSNYSDFPHPFPGDTSTQVTPKTIFRGVGNGVRDGPYISQFLILDIPWGSQKLEQKQAKLTNRDYLTKYDDWLGAQNGNKIPDTDEPSSPAESRHIFTPRDLAFYVHKDALYQAYLGACLILLKGVNEKHYHLDDLLPLNNSHTQMGFGTFGGPHILSLVTEVATRALKAVWFQKWIVHRRLRPEAFGGLIHRQKNSTSPSPTPVLTAPNPSYGDKISPEILNSGVLPKIFQHNANSNSPDPGSYLLPQAWPEGSPTHPSYGAGHATVAGACVTILKAWFKEEDPIDHPMRPKESDDGQTLEDLPSGGPTLTVGGELNKVAANIAIGRNWGGVHYRSDYTESIVLGENIALGILQEQSLCYHKDDPFKCTLTKFDGNKIKIEGKNIS